METVMPITEAAGRHFTPILNAGHIYLESHSGSDLSIVNAARVSFGKRTDEMDDKGEGLIRYLVRNRHGTPFEHNSMTFVVKAPIFVFREWHRHRIASVNEMSARYTELPREWYIPDRDAIRSQVGKPGAYRFERMENDALANIVINMIDEACATAFDTYQWMLDQGVAKEVARGVLPVNMYSEMWWTVNLRGLMNFLSLRNSPHAQREIREYAHHLECIALNLFPVAMAAFIDNGRVAP